MFISSVLEEGHVCKLYVYLYFALSVICSCETNDPSRTSALNHTILVAVIILWLSGLSLVVRQILLGGSADPKIVAEWLHLPFLCGLYLHMVPSSKLAGLLNWQLRTPTVLRGWKWALLVLWNAWPGTGLPLILHPISAYGYSCPVQWRDFMNHTSENRVATTAGFGVNV